MASILLLCLGGSMSLSGCTASYNALSSLILESYVSRLMLNPASPRSITSLTRPYLYGLRRMIAAISPVRQALSINSSALAGVQCTSYDIVFLSAATSFPVAACALLVAHYGGVEEVVLCRRQTKALKVVNHLRFLRAADRFAAGVLVASESVDRRAYV